MIRCPIHADDEPCPRKDAQDAAELVAAAKTDREAARLAAESLRIILANWCGAKLRSGDPERLIGVVAAGRGMDA